MTEFIETLGEKTKENLLRNMLENLASELAPQYEGKVVIKRYKKYADMYDVIDPHQNVIEEKSRKLFGILPITKRKTILEVNENYGNRTGDKRFSDIYVYLRDSNAEAVVKKYINQFAEEQGIKQIHISKE